MIERPTKRPYRADDPVGTRWVMRLGLVLTALVNGSVAAQPDPAPVTGEVLVKTLADAPLRGHLHRFSLQDDLRLTATDPIAFTTVPADEVVEIAFGERPAAARRGRGGFGTEQKSQVVVELVGGDSLSGRPLPPRDDGGAEEVSDSVRLETAHFGAVDLPLRLITRWSNTAASSPSLGTQNGGPCPPYALSTVGRAHPTQSQHSEDRLLLANGDVLRGLLLAIDDGGVTFETNGAGMNVPHAQVAVVDLVPETLPQTVGLRAYVTFADGSRLTTTDLTIADEDLRLSLFGGEKRTVALDRVARIELDGGRWVWITALEPISVQHTPMFSLSWPYRRNANVLGGPMRIANRSFAHGLGVHSESALTFDLAGRYEAFVTFLGLDDSAGPLADVTAEIRVDGQVGYRREHVTAGELLGPVRVDTRGAARIELRVLFGANSAIQDRFNWADAGLIREP